MPPKVRGARSALSRPSASINPASGSPSAENIAGARTRRRYGRSGWSRVILGRGVSDSGTDSSPSRLRPGSVPGPSLPGLGASAGTHDPRPRSLRAIGGEQLLEQQLLHRGRRYLSFGDEPGIAGDEHRAERGIVGEAAVRALHERRVERRDVEQRARAEQLPLRENAADLELREADRRDRGTARPGRSPACGGCPPCARSRARGRRRARSSR